jgi:biopolymer transport protein ExbB/TolQ
VRGYLGDPPAQAPFACAAAEIERARASVLIEYQRGAASLALISRTAPTLGLLSSNWSTVRWLNAPPCAPGDCAGGVAEVFVPLLLSLPVALFAQFVFAWLCHCLQQMDFEVQIQIPELAPYFSQLSQRV